jgi:hypothetical protein
VLHGMTVKVRKESVVRTMCSEGEGQVRGLMLNDRRQL